MAESITSLQNPRIKALVRMRKRRERDQTKRFLIEGYRELRRAVDRQVTIETLYICEELFLGTNEPQLITDAAANGAEVVEVGANPFSKVSYRDRPEGLLAVAEQFDTDLESIAPNADRWCSWSNQSRSPAISERCSEQQTRRESVP